MHCQPLISVAGNNSVRFECECECQGKVALPTLTTCAERVGHEQCEI